MSLTILLHKWYSTKSMQFSISNGGLLESEIAAKGRFGFSPGAAQGRLHAVTNGSFRETKLQWRIFGDEIREAVFASRPRAAGPPTVRSTATN